jgi:hypothetical protein
MQCIENDDQAYFAWLAANQNGYVLNVRSTSDPQYVVLHRASCASISNPKLSDGAYAGRSYRKWCGNSIAELRQAAKREGRGDGSFSKECGLCQP